MTSMGSCQSKWHAPCVQFAPEHFTYYYCLPAGNEPQADESQGDPRHHDRDGAMVEEAEQHVAEPDANNV